MHLLAATPGSIDDGSEPFDLGQTPADIVFISAADTELAGLSEARSTLGEDIGSLRLASMMHLQHPMSVDLHIENCAGKSKLVIARVLGGTGYWKYGLEQYASRLGAAGIAFVVLPGDDKPDPELWDLSTVNREDWEALWAYMVEGGSQNAENFLRYARAMLDGTDKPEQAKPLLRAGVYWPGAGIADLSAAQANWTDDAPIVPIIFYRALVQGAGLNPINRLVKSLLKRGLNPLPIFVASLKDEVSVATLQSLFEIATPSVILNCTSFAVGSPHQDEYDKGVLNDHMDTDLRNLAKVLAEISGLAVFVSIAENDSYYTGLSNLFRQPEFQEINLICSISEVVDHMEDVMPRVRGNLKNRVNELLGKNNPFGMDCGALATKVNNSIIGILGPMRMDYPNNYARLDFIKQSIN